MQPHHPRQIRLELGKAALRPGDDGGGLDVLVGIQHLVQLFPLPGLVHEEGQIRVHGDVQRVGVFPGPAHMGDDAPAGLLGGLLTDALPALQLLLRRVGLGHAALGVEKQDLMRPGLHAFLDDVLGLVPLRQTAEHRHLDAGLRRAGDDLDHLGLHLFLVRAHQAALVVRALPVADDHILAQAHAQHVHMLRVPAPHDRHAAEDVGSGHEKSRHLISRPVSIRIH